MHPAHVPCKPANALQRGLFTPETQRSPEELENLPLELFDAYSELTQGISSAFHVTRNISLTNQHNPGRSAQSIEINGRVPSFLQRYREIRVAAYQSLLDYSKETGDFRLLLQTIDTLQDPTMARWLLAVINREKEPNIPIIPTTPTSNDIYYKKRKANNQEIDTFRKQIAAYARQKRIADLAHKALQTDNNVLQTIAYAIMAKTTFRASRCVTQVFLDPLAAIAQKIPIEVQCYKLEKSQPQY